MGEGLKWTVLEAVPMGRGIWAYTAQRWPPLKQTSVSAALLLGPEKFRLAVIGQLTLCCLENTRAIQILLSVWLLSPLTLCFVLSIVTFPCPSCGARCVWTICVLQLVPGGFLGIFGALPLHPLHCLSGTPVWILGLSPSCFPHLSALFANTIGDFSSTQSIALCVCVCVYACVIFLFPNLCLYT